MCHVGFDPLLELPPLDDFVALMSKQRRALKALILDQASHSAGCSRDAAVHGMIFRHAHHMIVQSAS